MCTPSSCPWPVAPVSFSLPMKTRRKTTSSGWRSKVRCRSCWPSPPTSSSVGNPWSAGKAWPGVWGAWESSQVRPSGMGYGKVKEGYGEGLKCGLHPGNCRTQHPPWGWSPARTGASLVSVHLHPPPNIRGGPPMAPQPGCVPSEPSEAQMFFSFFLF